MDESVPVSKLFVSEQNQAFFSNLVIGNIGPNTIFGDIDAYYDRCHPFTLTLKSETAEVYAINVPIFQRITQEQDSPEYSKYAKAQDLVWMNKLAHTINNYHH